MISSIDDLFLKTTQAMRILTERSLKRGEILPSKRRSAAAPFDKKNREALVQDPYLFQRYGAYLSEEAPDILLGRNTEMKEHDIYKVFVSSAFLLNDVPFEWSLLNAWEISRMLYRASERKGFRAREILASHPDSGRWSSKEQFPQILDRVNKGDYADPLKNRMMSDFSADVLHFMAFYPEGEGIGDEEILSASSIFYNLGAINRHKTHLEIGSSFFDYAENMADLRRFIHYKDEDEVKAAFRGVLSSVLSEVRQGHYAVYNISHRLDCKFHFSTSGTYYG